MKKQAIPSLFSTWFRLAWRTSLLTVFVYGLGALSAPWVLKMSRSHVVPIGSLVGVLLGVLVVEAMLSPALAVFRLRDLHRLLRKRIKKSAKKKDDENLSEAPAVERYAQKDRNRGIGAPISRSLLLDAFYAPARFARPSLFLVAMVLCLDAAGLHVLPQVDAPKRFALDLFLFAFGLGSVQLRTMAWRAVLWSWLRHVAPFDMRLPPRSTVRRHVISRVVTPTAMMTLGAASVLLAHVWAVFPMNSMQAYQVYAVGVMVFLGACVAAGLLSHRFGKIVSADLRALSFRVSALASATSDPSIHEATAALVRPSRTKSASNLARAIHALSEQYQRLAREQRIARAAIEEAQRMKTRLMACMSHDLRSPLNSIKGFTEILIQETDGPLNDAQRESVDMIRQSGNDLLMLVADILDWAKLDAGRLRIMRGWTPPVELITQAVGRCAQLLEVDDLEKRVEVSIEPGLPPLYVDGERIVQAIVGVLRHVLRIMPQEGSVQVQVALRRPEERPPAHQSHQLPLRFTSGQEKFVQFEIVDVSAGIRTGERERIFEAFREMREPSGKRSGGLGLGLAVARSLLLAHGGELWYEWRRPYGTMFCLALGLEGPRSIESEIH